MNGEYREVENLGPVINTEHSEFDLQIAPDESHIMFVSNRPGGHDCMGYRNNLYVSFICYLHVKGRIRTVISTG